MEAIEKSPAASLATQAQSRPILDLISQTFPPFDHRASIVTPFENENQRDAKFQEGQSYYVPAELTSSRIGFLVSTRT